MIQLRYAAQKLAALALIAAAAVSFAPTAYALPHFGFRAHPADPNDTRILVKVYNKGGAFRDVKVDGKIYTALPHYYMTIKAPQGTPVFTNSTGALHHKGDLLFRIDRSMENKVLDID